MIDCHCTLPEEGRCGVGRVKAKHSQADLDSETEHAHSLPESEPEYEKSSTFLRSGHLFPGLWSLFHFWSCRGFPEPTHTQRLLGTIHCLVLPKHQGPSCRAAPGAPRGSSFQRAPLGIWPHERRTVSDSAFLPHVCVPLASALSLHGIS